VEFGQQQTLNTHTADEPLKAVLFKQWTPSSPATPLWRVCYSGAVYTYVYKIALLHVR